MGLEQHRADGAGSLGCAVVTVSDTRDASRDRGGPYLVERLEGAGHRVLERRRVRDERDEIQAAARELCAREGVQLVLFTGGTGIAARDVTAPSLEALFERPIPGFGELFRLLSYQEVGSATILSRACAGVRGGRVVVALPGSPKALVLAMDRILLPEAGHLVQQAGR